jgi:prepilin-type N-terminal cleavage/methylation domain-containing protein
MLTDLNCRWRAAQRAPVLALPQRRRFIAGVPHAFTLIEVMMVIGIAAIVMAVSVPFVYRALHKDPISKAANDLMEACHHARAQAILRGLPMELRILPQDGSFQVITATLRVFETALGTGGAGDGGGSSGGTLYSGRLPDDVFIEELGVNFAPLKDADDVRIRFHPNGTSDEFTIVFQYQQQWRKISLDVITGLAELEVIR